MKSTIYLSVVLFAVALISPAAAISSCAVSHHQSSSHPMPRESAALLTEGYSQQMCINNMLALASKLGCDPTNVSCLCNNKDFGYGINDCTSEACGSADLPDVQSYGASMCASMLSFHLPSSVKQNKS
jgi:hypothetical protein